MEDQAARKRVARLEGLLERAESLPDPAARETASELAHGLLDLYGEGLRRIVELLGEGSRALTADELVEHLLLLHDLHPEPLDERVGRALDEVRPYLASHGGGVELLAIEEGTVRLRMHGSCDGCPSSAMTLKLAIEEAIHKAAPEVESIEAEGAAAPERPALLQLEVSEALRPDGGWTTAGVLSDLSGGGTVLKPVAGEPLLFAKVEGSFYAYRPGCPSCGGSLEDAALAGRELACPGCGHRYDLKRAGRSLEGGELHLEPVPLLEDPAGLVKVALPAAV